MLMIKILSIESLDRHLKSIINLEPTRSESERKNRFGNCLTYFNRAMLYCRMGYTDLDDNSDMIFLDPTEDTISLLSENAFELIK